MIRLGIIGISEGNGHPYSWSAICNGYNASVMQSCPFPAIPQYLAERRFPEDQLPNARVTHIWTQDDALSSHIASSSLIPHTVNQLNDLIGRVDAILLARDDARQHCQMAVPFLRAGLPVYVDKPAALSVTDLDEMYLAARSDDLLFSCSALRYSSSLRLDPVTRTQIGTVRHIECVVPKYWDTYAVHLLDPIFSELNLYESESTVRVLEGNPQVTHITFPKLTVTLTCLGHLPGELKFRYYGERGFVDRYFTDTFESFRSALSAFVDGVERGVTHTPRNQLTSIVRILERGAR
ncbi:MAG: hypothetical protein FJ184_02330 [Gammaproteobacteria bacterium]|nr:hypothetical protein [Gammaproteobacteria bacterium]